MSSNKPKGITVTNPGFLKDLMLRIKLILRLMGDSRVNPIVKLLPIGSLIYLIWPFDLPTPIDDAAVLWLGNYLFVELCPPNVVQEHLAQLRQIPSVNWDSASQPDDVVDAEYHETRE
jgi:hypothetical protein